MIVFFFKKKNYTTNKEHIFVKKKKNKYMNIERVMIEKIHIFS